MGIPNTPKKRRQKRDVIIPDIDKVTPQYWDQLRLKLIPAELIAEIYYDKNNRIMVVRTIQGRRYQYSHVESSIHKLTCNAMMYDSWDESVFLPEDYVDPPPEKDYDTIFATQIQNKAAKFAHLIK